MTSETFGRQRPSPFAIIGVIVTHVLIGWLWCGHVTKQGPPEKRRVSVQVQLLPLPDLLAVDKTPAPFMKPARDAHERSQAPRGAPKPPAKTSAVRPGESNSVARDGASSGSIQPASAASLASGAVQADINRPLDLRLPTGRRIQGEPTRPYAESQSLSDLTKLSSTTQEERLQEGRSRIYVRDECLTVEAVSYTHLTLPTKRIV